jgi:predicted ribosome quality control (RQC) complex YloA/Tae2 family protein
MYFDAVTIGALVAELSDRLGGGRIQDSVQIDAESFGLEVYAHRERHYLLLSANQQYPRVLLSAEKLRRGVPKPSPLGLLLRRYAEGARIDTVRQPAWERLIFFDLDGPEGVFTLVVEPMERRANLLLVRADGVIADCVRRVGPEENRVRVSLPGHPYEPPPPQKLKREPQALTLTLLGDLLDSAPGEQTRQLLTKQVLGFSPLVAKEVVFRATGETNIKAADTSPRALLGAIEDFFGALDRGEWEPGVAVDEDGVLAYAVYRLTHVPGWEPCASVSEALERYYGPLTGEGAYEAAKRPVAAALDEARDRVRKKLESLERSLADEAALEQLRQSGELLLAYQYTLTPGQTEFKAQYEVDGPELTIELDPALSPIENAKRYFERYEKAKRSRESVPELIESAQQELDYLDQLATDLELATNWPEIGEVQAALQANGYWRGKPVGRPGGGQSAPLKVTTDDGWVIWVGRNARQNDVVTFDKGGSMDLWLHARGVPGAHVIVKSSGRDVPPHVLERAASLAAYYSGARTEARVIVDMTLRKYVRKIKGGKPGMVTYRNESTIEVVPRPE